MSGVVHSHSVFSNSESQVSATTPVKPGPFGAYHLRELINSGGMADIWLATDKDDNTFALRRLHDNLRFNFLARKRFLRGCEILSKIHNHDCVIGYYEHGKIDGALYLLMEYVEGANLKELYASHDPVLLENVGNIIIDMAVGLEHVHESGYMHLDFKPENVLVTRNASVRVADFDLSQPIPKKPAKMAKNPGTPTYMAPEQLKREEVDQRADIFAFGVAAYELLTNYKPFPGETPAEILARQVDRSGFVSPREHNPDLPLSLEKLILRCIAQDPDKRYPLMTVVVHELKTALYV
ncbi:MAG: Serine/threonine protein kinase [Pedosphaera sp.]|nr:Serine/threonine protein kinase [Pedosphaera sp.]